MAIPEEIAGDGFAGILDVQPSEGVSVPGRAGVLAGLRIGRSLPLLLFFSGLQRPPAIPDTGGRLADPWISDHGHWFGGGPDRSQSPIERGNAVPLAQGRTAEFASCRRSPIRSRPYRACAAVMSLTVIGPTHPFRGGIAHYTTLL